VLVCTNCRSENLEDARFCKTCGRALDAVNTPMRSQREPDQEVQDLEMPAPKSRSLLPVILIVGVVAAVSILGVVWATGRPNPCEGKFSSVLFGYCAELPEGWRGGSQITAQEDIDEFVPQNDDAVTWVRVREIVDPATQTQQYAQQFRISQEAEGLEPTQVEVVPLDGEEALAWEVTVDTEDGDALQVREVVLVREDGLWRITLAATADAYPSARASFEQLLSTWTWR
jgi:hypothetical protein